MRNSAMSGTRCKCAGNPVLTENSAVHYELNMCWFEHIVRAPWAGAPPSFPTPAHKCLGWDDGRGIMKGRKQFIEVFACLFSVESQQGKISLMIRKFLAKTSEEIPEPELKLQTTIYFMNFKKTDISIQSSQKQKEYDCLDSLVDSGPTTGKLRAWTVPGYVQPPGGKEHTKIGLNSGSWVFPFKSFNCKELKKNFFWRLFSVSSSNGKVCS